jgi:hypothetical protein
VDVCVYLPDEIGAWYEQHREELGRGWASRVLRDAAADERERAGKSPEEREEEYRAVMAELCREVPPIDLTGPRPAP